MSTTNREIPQSRPSGRAACCLEPPNVRFGSKAAYAVQYIMKSGHVQCRVHVGFGPRADIRNMMCCGNRGCTRDMRSCSGGMYIVVLGCLSFAPK
jgi:hypothetical protein